MEKSWKIASFNESLTKSSSFLNVLIGISGPIKGENRLLVGKKGIDLRKVEKSQNLWLILAAFLFKDH